MSNGYVFRQGSMNQFDKIRAVFAILPLGLVFMFLGVVGLFSGWAMIAPSTLSAFKNHAKPIGAGAWAKAFWCLSPAPVVFLCFGLYRLMAYGRITE